MNEKYYHIITYGCQMNEADSETLAGILYKKGYIHTDNLDYADVILLVTCAVREHAEQRIYGKMGDLMQLKQLKPSLIIGIGGCMPQQIQVAKKLKSNFPKLDLIFGTHNLHEFEELFDKALLKNEKIFEIHDIDGLVVENLPKNRKYTHKASINITYGCNNFCTYCIVPHVRGRERSRKQEHIVNEVKGLVANGYKEVTLLGQNVNSYGNDLSSNISFETLLEQLANIKGLLRIRFMTPHPKDMSDKLIEIVKKYDNICNHIHLPMQSGSTNVLKAMNRKYTKEQYLELALKVRKEIPNCTITTDIIVGFPGETEQDFLDTLDVVNAVKFDAAFTFAYSKREGTPAAKYENQVPEAVKKERLHTLIKKVQSLMLTSNESYFGKELDVMIEGSSKRNDNVLSARTDTYKLVHLVGDYKTGDIVRVKINKVSNFTLWAEAL